MFVILTYDVKQKRVGKVLKICRKYLIHMQKSVFEGVITEAKLKKLKKEIEQCIDTNKDMVCIYALESMKYVTKEQIGIVKNVSHII